MLDETESSTALKPKISLEMLLRDIELYWEKNISSINRMLSFSSQEDGLDFQRFRNTGISCANSDNHGDSSTFSWHSSFLVLQH